MGRRVGGKAMRQKNFIIKVTALVCGTVLLAAGCSKEGRGTDYSGTPVLLTGRAPSSAGTKTVYSGYTEGSKFERIEWEIGDVLRLCSDKAWVSNNDRSENYGLYYSDYKVDNVVTSSDRIHVADKLSNVLGNGLVWQDNGVHRFWGVYPAPGSAGVDANLAITGFSSKPAGTESVTATLPFPGEQTVTRKAGTGLWLADLKKGGYLLAGQNASAPEGNGVVNFDFYPAFTSFEIVFGADTEMEVTGFEIYSGTSDGVAFNDGKAATALSGNATATLNGTTWNYGTVARTDANGKITVTLSEPVKLIPKTAEAKEGYITEAHLTVLALPQELSGLTIKFMVKTGSDTDASARTLRLTMGGKWVDFPARQKAYIKGLLVPGSVWQINFGPSVKDWKELDETINLIV